ncbi:MAG: type II toxin-antitoxin system RelE/ParE family toxin [Planctomycetes bacterium]|jgi:plasmid stabilization system protein ParE|nr:type II toxin-antitoxin system RelE/ParE family toxin [Phycisphaerae bacterium]NBB95856.1 type II toxin-antitoxin system RelE/ParE family toxin [Planctomycetota bacterium]
MSRRFIVRPEAEAEMTDAFDWYEGRVGGLGSELLLCVDAVFSAILRSPQQFPRVHKIVRRTLTRRFPYEVLFVEDDERIGVLSVFHAKRNPKRWRERT